ncbi:MAG: FtsX-like permease family protein [Anaerolineales bacterium]|nr:FtsX-like permease family protein [Anaerolineales bacterium]MCA9927977.1 FtsX-like permease family protein [Anaerolineales bacterium]
MQVRWRKVFLDLLGNRTRTLLVVLAITVGVFAVGFVAGAQTILLRELNRGYVASSAASAVVHTQPFDEAFVNSVMRLPEVAVAEGRRTVQVKVLLGNQERRLILTAVPDLTNMQLDKVYPVAGQWPPAGDGVLIEQLSLPFVEGEIGSTLRIELDNGDVKHLNILGSVHDANVPRAEIMDAGFGFVSQSTLASLGIDDSFTELRYRVAEDAHSITHIEAVNALIEDKIEKSGRFVFYTETPTPGEHWAQGIIETLVLLFTVFGFLILGLAGFLVINTITALITQQVQQIGIMKLVGGRRPQIMSMYFVMVLAYGSAALLIGVPVSILMAQWVVQFAANLLNVQIQSSTVPSTVVLMQVAVGLLVPLLAALWPVIQGVQITTHRALNNLGIQSGSAEQRLTDRLMAQLQRWLPVQRPLIISFRNTVRKKSRLILTLLTLIMGTALFIAVLSVRDSVELTIDNFLRYHEYDVSLALERPYRTIQLSHLAEQVPGVTAVEGWVTGSARRLYDDESLSGTMALTAVPANTRFMSPALESGRWLNLSDDNAIVVNTDFMDDEPDVQIGDQIMLNFEGRELPWQVVGVVNGSASGAAAFVNYNYFSKVAGYTGQATTLKVITQQHDADYQAALVNKLETHLEANGIRVSASQTTENIRTTTKYRFNIIIGFLVLMAVLLAVVGGLGLTTTMSINVLERIREIGVLRAIGASDNAVRQIVLAEGLFIGMLSWFVGSFLSLPTAQLLSQQVGMALLGFPLNFHFAFAGMFLWLLLILFLAVAASLGPAHNASQLTIREVLSYE